MAKTQEAHPAMDTEGWTIRWLQINLTLVENTLAPFNILTSDSVDEYPDGYPRFAAFMTCDVNTRLYRRFGWERNRLLLHKQDEVVVLSDELKALDAQDEYSHRERLYSRRKDIEQTDCKRSEILRRLTSQLKEYDDLLLREHAVASLPECTARNHKGVYDWVYNTKPVYTSEYQYLNQQDDFALLGNQHDLWARAFAEKLFALTDIPILGVGLVIYSSSRFPIYVSFSERD